MNAVTKYSRPVRRISIPFGLIVVLALILASVPGSTQAAANCASYHTVQQGETTVSIAQFYGVKWGSIALANNLKEPFRLTVGQVLCIPEGDVKGKDKDKEDDSPSAFEKATFTATVYGNRVLVYVAGLKSKNVFTVKVREVVPKVSEWTKLGVLKVDKNEKLSQFYNLPAALGDAALITLCLKNATSDELACRTVVHPQ
ncbi:MAG TPA: LysM domain-containing protein [Anaerolineales bacterium]|nr:LysM domain-containing protein [Anaerolineales bacterium]